MKAAVATPLIYNKKATLFGSARRFAHATLLAPYAMLCKLIITSNLYIVESPNGQHEVIPETFLKAKPADAIAAGRVDDDVFSWLAEPDFWEPFNKRDVVN